MSGTSGGWSLPSSYLLQVLNRTCALLVFGRTDHGDTLANVLAKLDHDLEENKSLQKVREKVQIDFTNCQKLFDI